MEIGKPIKRYTVIPLKEPIPPTKEPQQAPPPRLPAPVKEPA